MMKKLLAILTALMLLFTSAAMAEDLLDTEAAEAAFTLTVLDAEGNTPAGMQVRILGQYSNEEYLSFVTGEIFEEKIAGATTYGTEDGITYTFSGMEAGTWYVRATDPADGYSASALIDSRYTGDIQLVIRKLQPGSVVKVGAVTPVTGEFATDLWSNNTSDLDVRGLLHESNISWTNDLQYVPNFTMLESVEATHNMGRDKTFTFVLNEGLQFSDGSPITAKDFVFSVLAQSAPELEKVDASAKTYQVITGYDAYVTGRVWFFEGVRYIDEKTFSLTVSADALPYFYEMTYVAVHPYPMSVIAPGCDVVDDGAGAYLTGSYDVEALRSYSREPSVTSGAYMLTSVNDGVVTLKANPYYKGNYEGQRPLIETIELSTVTYETALDAIANSELDIVNKISRADVIDAAMTLQQEEKAQVSNYMRTGMGYLALACEDEVMSSENVRKAIASCVDKNAMITDYLGTNGVAVDSYYGLGQWMYAAYTALNDATVEEELTKYEVSAEAAIDLLTADGWTKNAEGGDYVEGIRYKDFDGELKPLQIRFAKIADNGAAQWIADNAGAALQAVGFDFVTEEMAYTDVLDQLYRHTERTANMMFIASNFNVVFDPYYTFHTADEYQGVSNQSGIRDEALMEAAAKMRSCDAEDQAGYVTAWAEMVKRYADILPGIPLYSNVYYDVADMDINDYTPNSTWSWSSAILYTWIGE